MEFHGIFLKIHENVMEFLKFHGIFMKVHGNSMKPHGFFEIPLVFEIYDRQAAGSREPSPRNFSNEFRGFLINSLGRENRNIYTSDSLLKFLGENFLPELTN